MLPGTGILASADPMEHIVDAPLFDGVVSKGSWLYDVSDHLYGLGITKQVALFFIAGILTVLFFWSYVRQIKRNPDAVPGRWGNFVETILDTLRDQLVLPFMGESGLKFLPILATFFVYILICNLIGLIPMPTGQDMEGILRQQIPISLWPWRFARLFSTTGSASGNRETFLPISRTCFRTFRW